MAVQATVATDTIQGEGLIHGPGDKSQMKVTFQLILVEQ